MQLAELADQLEAAQERFDYGAIEALCEQNRALRPRLAECLEGLKRVTPQTPEEQELVALAANLDALAKASVPASPAFSVASTVGTLGTFDVDEIEALNVLLRSLESALAGARLPDYVSAYDANALRELTRPRRS